MTRVKHSVVSHKRHKKILKQSKGYYGARSKTFKIAKQSVIKSNQYAYRDRKVKKRQFRKLWIIKINAEIRKYNIKYSNFIYLLNKKSIEINRKFLSYIAQYNKDNFKEIINYISK